MRGRDPLLPNAWIVARREYRDRVRSPLFVASTVVLMGLAMLVAVAPIGIRYLDRETVTHIAIVSDDEGLGIRAAAVADSLLNIPPQGADPAAWEKPFLIERNADRAAAEASLASGELAGVLIVQRLSSGQIDVEFRTNEGVNSARSQLLSIAAFGIGVLDWSSRLPATAPTDPFITPAYHVQALNTATEGGSRSTRRRRPAAGFSASSSSSCCSSPSSSTGCGSRPAWHPRRAAGSWS